MRTEDQRGRKPISWPMGLKRKGEGGNKAQTADGV